MQVTSQRPSNRTKNIRSKTKRVQKAFTSQRGAVRCLDAVAEHWFVEPVNVLKTLIDKLPASL
eukprot:5039912-Amphidinium_carterae.1